jgi:hypothetical protein
MYSIYCPLKAYYTPHWFRLWIGRGEWDLPPPSRGATWQQSGEGRGIFSSNGNCIGNPGALFSLSLPPLSLSLPLSLPPLSLLSPLSLCMYTILKLYQLYVWLVNLHVPSVSAIWIGNTLVPIKGVSIVWLMTLHVLGVLAIWRGTPSVQGVSVGVVNGPDCTKCPSDMYC